MRYCQSDPCLKLFRAAAALKAKEYDVAALTDRPLLYEKLDQLVTELLLGIR